MVRLVAAIMFEFEGKWLKHTPAEQTLEVAILYPAGSRSFFSSLLYPTRSASLIQVPQKGATKLIFLQKVFLSEQLEAKQVQYLSKFFLIKLKYKNAYPFEADLEFYD